MSHHYRNQLQCTAVEGGATLINGSYQLELGACVFAYFVNVFEKFSQDVWSTLGELKVNAAYISQSPSLPLPRQLLVRI